jgi:hypothetical protein
MLAYYIVSRLPLHGLWRGEEFNKGKRSVLQMNKDQAINALQSIHAWAKEARCNGCSLDILQFKDIEEWSKEIIALLNEQESLLEEYHKADGFLTIHGWWSKDRQ